MTLSRLRHHILMNPGKSEVGHLPEDTQVSFVPMESIKDGSGGLDLQQQKPLSEVGGSYTYFADGDVVVAKVTPCFENGKKALASGLVNGIAFGSSELHVLRPRPTLLPRYLVYLVGSASFRDQCISSMTGAGGLRRVSDEAIKNFRIRCVSTQEQDAIVGFLDEHVGAIDKAIERNQRLIKAIQEERNVMIARAVTHGLDPNVTMKDSGVAWFGLMPAHWRVTKIKHISERVVDCLHTTPNYDGQVKYPAIRTADVEPGKILIEQARLVSEEVYFERTSRLRPMAGDILYSREGERFGIAALVPDGVELCLGQRMMMFRIKQNVYSKYVMWLLNSPPIYQQVIEKNAGSTSPHINIEEVINFEIALPGIEEQKNIANYVEVNYGISGKIIRKCKEMTRVLQEYSSTLITAAVTGQIDVTSRTAHRTVVAELERLGA